VTFYTLCAFVSALLGVKWMRADVGMKSSLWSRYGWFTMLIFAGCIAGGAFAALETRSRYYFQRFSVPLVDGSRCGDYIQQYDIQGGIECYATRTHAMAQVAFFFAVSVVPFGIEFLCISCAKLLVRLHPFGRLFVHALLIFFSSGF
jgi:hypothetical protein